MTTKITPELLATMNRAYKQVNSFPPTEAEKKFALMKTFPCINGPLHNVTLSEGDMGYVPTKLGEVVRIPLFGEDLLTPTRIVQYSLRPEGLVFLREEEEDLA